MTLAIDGHISGHASNGTSASVTLTTTNANDVIVVAAYAEANSSSLNPSISGISATGVTGWTQREVVSHTGGTGYALSLWYGKASAALSAVSISVSFGAHFDDCSIVAFGVSGTNFSSPWDPNSGLPSGVICTKNTAPTTTISTSNAHDMLIAVTGSTSATSTQVNTEPSGWSNVGFDINGGGGLASQVGVADLVVSSTQSSLTVTWGSSVGQVNANDNVPYIVDALTADSSSGGGGPAQYAVTIVS